MVKNMVFMTEKYVFIDSEADVDEESAKKIQSLPKTFVQQLQKMCEFITEYSYDEHKKAAILVCRFKNENEFCETTRMEDIAKVINIMHQMIARYISDSFEEAMNECSKQITKLIKINGDEEISGSVNDCDELPWMCCPINKESCNL